MTQTEHNPTHTTGRDNVTDTNIEQTIAEREQRREEFSKANQEKTMQRIADLLAAAGGGLTTGDNSIQRHADRTRGLISIHESLQDDEAANMVVGWAKANKEMETYEMPSHIRVRPHDGAVMMQRFMMDTLGVGASGLPIHSFFGSQPPEQISVQVGPGKNDFVSVYWGLCNLPHFKGELFLGEKDDNQYGKMFQAHILAPKNRGKEIRGFWNLFAEYVKGNSIYKGKAVSGLGQMPGQPFQHPTFLDPNVIDPRFVSYPKETHLELRNGIWGRIFTAHIQRKLGIKLNRKVLMSGTYGTGKSLGAGLAMRYAVEAGWTVIKYQIGENLDHVLNMAQQLAPAVVIIEDCDTLISDDNAEMMRMLERFDGISTKDREVMVVMTTNHVKELTQGMTRVGRTDQITEIGYPDAEAIERIAKAEFAPNEELEPIWSPDLKWAEKVLDSVSGPIECELGSVNWEEVQKELEGYTMSFIVGIFQDAKSNAVVRSFYEGDTSGVFNISTEDLIIAARGKKAQHQIHVEAPERAPKDSLTEGLVGVMGQALNAHKVDFRNEGDIIAKETANA